MQGKRHDYDDSTVPIPGEYGKNMIGQWYGAPPTEPDEDGFLMIAALSKHQVVEHEDSTITVSPSILISQRRAGTITRQWHGFLEHGIWREV